MSDFKRVLVTGATGYIGGRLLPLLTADGWRVRCLARQPEILLPRVPLAKVPPRSDGNGPKRKHGGRERTCVGSERLSA